MRKLLSPQGLIVCPSVSSIYPVYIVTNCLFTFSSLVVGQALVEQGLKADEWLKGLCSILGGKSGGKAVSAQCSGPNIEHISQAVDTAKDFARLKLR